MAAKKMMKSDGCGGRKGKDGLDHPPPPPKGFKRPKKGKSKKG